MGKGAAKQSQQIAGQAANNFSSLYGNLSSGAAPALKQSQDYYSAIIKGGPQAYAAVAPAAEFTKQQFSNANRQLQDTAPAGGYVPAARTQLAQSQAQTISGLYQNNINNALQSLTGLGLGETQGALGATQGQTTVSGQLAQLAAQQLSAWTSGIGSLAGGFGTLFGNIFKAKPA
jgi:hypothetical protein